MEQYAVFIGEPCVDEYYQVLGQWPNEGEKFLTKYDHQNTGGMIANASCVMAGYGEKTYCLCSLFKDNEYDFLMHELNVMHVDPSYIVTLDEGRNGKCLIYSLEDGERNINVIASDEKPLLNHEDYLDLLENASFIYTSPSQIQMFKEPKELLKHLHNKGVRIAFDCESSCYRKDWKDFIQYATYVSMNDYAIEIYGEGKKADVVSKEVLDLGVNIFVETLGSKGSHIYTKEKDFIIEPYPTNVVDTTGAGDTYNSSFVYGLIKDWDIEKAGHFATAAASLAIQKKGARSGTNDVNTVLKFMEEN